MATSAEAQKAVFAQIVRVAKVIENSGTNSGTQAEAVANLALALRYAVGGPQPGTSVITK